MGNKDIANLPCNGWRNDTENFILEELMKISAQGVITYYESEQEIINTLERYLHFAFKVKLSELPVILKKIGFTLPINNISCRYGHNSVVLVIDVLNEVEFYIGDMVDPYPSVNCHSSYIVIAKEEKVVNVNKLQVMLG